MTDMWSVMFSRSGMLMTSATTQKEQGDLDAAIETLRAAYLVAAEEGVDHGIQAHLRLPLYLHRAGRKAEAWAEFNHLALEGYPGMEERGRDRMILNLSAIFDKMRLTLQRDKMPEQAVRFGVWSLLCMLGESSSISHLSKDWIAQETTKLLKKAKRLDLLPVVLEMIDGELLRSEFNLPLLGERIDHLFGIDTSYHLPELP